MEKIKRRITNEYSDVFNWWSYFAFFSIYSFRKKQKSKTRKYRENQLSRNPKAKTVKV